jgi:hypothetical protein
MPVVFIDAPGSTYWLEWLDFIKRHMLQQGLISPADLHLFMITTDIDEAVYEITTFYRNYHSARYVDGQLIMRLQHPISEGLLTTLNRDFRDIVTQGEIVAGAPLGEDALEFPELPRLHLWFDRINYGRLRRLIDVVNQY